jgi:TPR repeat protein
MEKFKLALIEELASKGNREAILEIARFYSEEPNISATKSKQIVNYLLQLTKNNDTEAMLILGGWYYVGRGVKQNYKEAVKWYEKAAEKLDALGLCYLGYCYYHGRDMDVNYEKAYSCFSKSAFLGSPNAMYKLGDMYFHGQYVKEDKEAAFFWYNEGWKDVEDSYETASIEYRLGKCYLHGHGIEQDLWHALKMLQSAEKDFFELVESGDPFAEITLKSVRKEIDKARDKLYDLYDIEKETGI